MSTDYEFRCVACSDSFGRDNWRTPEQLAQLLPLREHFAAIAAGLKDFYLYGFDEGCISSLCAWFAGHAGHDVRVFDEYGRDWTRRDEMCECGHVYRDHLNYDGMRDQCIMRPAQDKRCEPHVFRRATS